VDAVGALVLAGIVVGAILGLVSYNPKLVLDEGSVSTAVFGLICLGSLATEKPMMYRLAWSSSARTPSGAATSPTCGSTRSSGARSWSSPWFGAEPTTDAAVRSACQGNGVLR
jgi:hypothetical protein